MGWLRLLFLFCPWEHLKTPTRTLFIMPSEGKDGVDSDSVAITSTEGDKCCCLPCRRGQKGKAHSSFKDYSDRGCTNLICLLFYVVFMIAWVVIGVMAFQYGTPDMYVHPCSLSLSHCTSSLPLHLCLCFSLVVGIFCYYFFWKNKKNQAFPPFLPSPHLVLHPLHPPCLCST